MESQRVDRLSTAERERNASRLWDELAEDVGEMAFVGRALAKKELADALKPYARRFICAVTAMIFGFAGILDLIRLAVATAVGGDVGVSRPWLGWSAFVLLSLAALVGGLGTRRRELAKERPVNHELVVPAH